MSQLCEWFKVNKLSLNLDKTCYSIFGSNHKNMTAQTLYIYNKVIQNVASCKYLGILIDSDLKWTEHIKYIHNKLIKFVSIFYKIRTKLPPEILRLIYFAFVHSHLLYGIEIYGNTTANHLSKLLVLNNRLLRTLQHKPFKMHTTDLYNSYFTLPLQVLHPRTASASSLAYSNFFAIIKNMGCENRSEAISAYEMLFKKYYIALCWTNCYKQK